jgi:hypothetical protein
MVTTVLIIVALMVLSVAAGKPYGWIALGLTVLALLAMLLGVPSVHLR